MTATYLYCVIASPRAPRAAVLARVPRGLPGAGRVRLLPVADGLFAVVADVPLPRYGEATINRQLSNLDWVSRAAVAHESVVEHFSRAAAVLPMKLFTIFSSDERALAYLTAERRQLAALARRVTNHEEWGVRLKLDRPTAADDVSRRAARRTSATGASTAIGREYLSRKKARRDASLELATRAQETASSLYDRLSAKARLARRRSTGDLPVEGASLLLDAAFLVARSRAEAFQRLAAKEARTLSPRGYVMTLTGPWPPYSFVQE